MARGDPNAGREAGCQGQTKDCARDRLPYVADRGARQLLGGDPLRLRAPGRRPSEFMLVHLLKSKIHKATVTAASVDYEGSLTIAEDLMVAAGFRPFERILCSNMANGARWETYVIRGPRGSGAIELNGAVAHLGKPGDRVTLMSFTEVEESAATGWEPRVIVLGPDNHIVNERGT